MTTAKHPRTARSPLFILFITVAIDLLGFGIILPLLPLYVKQFGGSPVMAGWLTASYSVMQFLFAPIWGRLSDLHGRRPLILLSLVGSAITFLLFGLATHLWILFAARIAAGITTAASLPTAQAYIADVTPPERRARGMAMIGVAFGIGFAIGPWIGGFLGRYSLALPALFVAGMAAVNFIWSFFALPESHLTDRDPSHARKIVILDTARFAEVFRTPALSELLSLFSFSTFAFALMEATFTWLVLYNFVGPEHHIDVRNPHIAKPVLDFLQSSAAATVGPMFGIVGITAVVSQGAVMGGLAQRVGEVRLIWTGALILIGALVGIALTHNIVVLTVLAALLAVGNGVMTPSVSSMISKAADPRRKGGVLGVQQSLSSFTRILAPPLGTWLLQRFSPAAPYVLSAVLMAIAFVLSLNLPKLPIGEATATGV